MASTLSVAVEPNFMIAPFPNCFSIWLIAVSIAFCLSTIFFSILRQKALFFPKKHRMQTLLRQYATASAIFHFLFRRKGRILHISAGKSAFLL